VRKINTQRFQRATRSTPREVNRRILLNLIRDHQPISRADLARRLKMSRGMVSSLVTELIGAGLVYQGATANAPRGRKPKLLHIRAHDRLVVGVDIRRRQTHLLLSDYAGGEIALERFRTPQDLGALLGELEVRVKRIISAHADQGECMGVGLVVPGLVDAETGVVLNAPTLGWKNVDVRADLAALLPVPVHIERDAVACALAKMWAGRRGEHSDNFAYVTVSDGVGAGLVINGQVVRGREHAAGEFGHIPLNLDGPPCFCGNRGCWEAYTSNPATVARYLGKELKRPVHESEAADIDLTVEDVIARSASGDASATEALEATGRYLGIGIAVIVNALAPQEVIVGGEVIAAWSIIGPALHGELAKRVLTESAGSTPVLTEPSDRDTRLQGAVVLVMGPEFAAPVIA
jgi:predicted NBD/HSP70 family sugar kinase